MGIVIDYWTFFTLLCCCLLTVPLYQVTDAHALSFRRCPSHALDSHLRGQCVPRADFFGTATCHIDDDDDEEEEEYYAASRAAQVNQYQHPLQWIALQRSLAFKGEPPLHWGMVPKFHPEQHSYWASVPWDTGGVDVILLLYNQTQAFARWGHEGGLGMRGENTGEEGRAFTYKVSTTVYANHQRVGEVKGVYSVPIQVKRVTRVQVDVIVVVKRYEWSVESYSLVNPRPVRVASKQHRHTYSLLVVRDMPRVAIRILDGSPRALILRKHSQYQTIRVFREFTAEEKHIRLSPMQGVFLQRDDDEEQLLLIGAASPSTLVDWDSLPTPEFRMSLNQVVQFSTKDVRSHRLMVRAPLAMAAKTDNILIVGGGDGLAAAEFLKYSHMWKLLVNVELDLTLIDLTKNHPLLRVISYDSFNHPKVKIYPGDGLQFLLDFQDKFDIIVDDCEFDVTSQPAEGRLRYERYLDALVDKLAPGGIGTMMEALDDNHEPPEQSEKWPDSKKMAWMQRVAKTENNFYEWKLRTDYVVSKLVWAHTVGPEEYAFWSNEPIWIRRQLQTKSPVHLGDPMMKLVQHAAAARRRNTAEEQCQVPPKKKKV